MSDGDLVFGAAIRQGDVDTIRRLIEQGDCDANIMLSITQDEFCQHVCDRVILRRVEPCLSALHIATVFGRMDVIELLLEKNANVNARTRDGRETPLILALDRAFFQVAEILLRRGGADTNLADSRTRTPLWYCCCSTGAHYIPTLLRYGARVEDSENTGWLTPLHFACRHHHLQLASILVEHGADVNACHQSRSPIFEANPNIMDMLVANGAQVNLQDRIGWSPLHRWAHTADEARCKFLLSNNANIWATTNCGATPLHVAVRNGNFGVARLILAHQRSRHGHGSVGCLLLKVAPGHSSVNVLHSATTARMARLLVEQCRGEDGVLLPSCRQLILAKNLYNDTPLEHARRGNSSEVVQYLESFTMSALATTSATSSDDDDDDAIAVMLNPSLDGFQQAIAAECLDLIRSSSVDVPEAALYITLGYLSALDTMKR